MAKTWKKTTKKKALERPEPENVVKPLVLRKNVRLRKQGQKIQFASHGAYPPRPASSATQGLPPKPRKPPKHAKFVVYLSSSRPSKTTYLVPEATYLAFEVAAPAPEPIMNLHASSCHSSFDLTCLSRDSSHVPKAEVVHMVEMAIANAVVDASSEGMLVSFETGILLALSTAQSSSEGPSFGCVAGEESCDLNWTTELNDDIHSEDINAAKELTYLASNIDSRSEPEALMNMGLSIVASNPVMSVATAAL
ncbi:hypothetical protein AMTR_s00044p00188410 [Amborella trichopoda]|uniref:Uncharacterized protein n=1 Tax=Amborella trichopoda TaxID=13333 RepID=U5D739_AMBTC|nr:hypothetical protein AMTR_s00044p00188410 [Amborella trichopoda]